MVKGNYNFKKLRREYVFPIIEKKLLELKESCPKEEIINVGIGDVSLPLAPSVATAVSAAIQEMSQENSLKGYGPSEGYLFLRQAVCENEYKNLSITPEEIFISDGINSEIANVLEIFEKKSTVAIPDPTYPVYLDTSLICGKKIHLMPCLEKSRCLPEVPKEKYDIIYLCSPSNPTGEALNREELKKFIDYALLHDSIILYDNAYCSFITNPTTPKSIYEIEGSHKVAIEFRSFSKSAGFTGLRCGYTVVPKDIRLKFGNSSIELLKIWKKRQSIKSNGVSYPVQKGALACFSEQGRKETSNQIATYLDSARALREGLAEMGYTCFGGVDAPYVWWKIPKNYSSWEFFDVLLKQCQIIAIPGRGFGEAGEGYIRLSAFTKLSKVQIALDRIKKINL